MRVQIMSRKQFEEYGWTPHKQSSIVISISSCGELSPFIVNNNSNKILARLNLFFNDTDDRNPVFGAMTSKEALEIIIFLDTYYNDSIDKVIVHCGAGQSRSAGIAAALLKYYTGDDSQIFDNPRYTPNMLCYRLLLQELIEMKGYSKYLK